MDLYVTHTIRKATFFINKKAVITYKMGRLFSNDLFLDPNGKVFCELKHKTSFWNLKYEIRPIKSRFFENCNPSTAIFKPIPATLKLDINGVFYETIVHKGFFTSIFRDNSQIAYWRPKGHNIGESIITTDFDSNLGIIAFLFVCTTNAFGVVEETPNITFGNIGPEKQPFDKTWVPKPGSIS